MPRHIFVRVGSVEISRRENGGALITVNNGERAEVTQDQWLDLCAALTAVSAAALGDE